MGGETELEFVAGDGVGATRCVSYPIINDNIPEGTEDFRVAISTDDADRLVIDDGRVRIFITDEGGKPIIHLINRAVKKFIQHVILHA